AGLNTSNLPRISAAFSASPPRRFRRTNGVWPMRSVTESAMAGWPVVLRSGATTDAPAAACGAARPDVSSAASSARASLDAVIDRRGALVHSFVLDQFGERDRLEAGPHHVVNLLPHPVLPADRLAIVLLETGQRR